MVTRVFAANGMQSIYLNLTFLLLIFLVIVRKIHGQKKARLLLFPNRRPFDSLWNSRIFQGVNVEVEMKLMEGDDTKLGQQPSRQRG